MKLRAHALSARSLAAGALLAAVFSAGAMIATASPEAVVARGFAAALEETADNAGTQRPVATISGTEEFWLAEKRRLAEDGSLEHAAWSGATPLISLAVGDHITLGAGSAQRVLKVVSVTETDEGGAGAERRSLKISARDASDPASPLVTFTTTIEHAPKDTKQARAL